MNKTRLCAPFFLIFSFAFFVLGCPPESDPGRTDPAFLLGTWQNPNATFEISEGLYFECRLVSVSGAGGDPAFVRGRLDPVTGPQYGPNDFRLRNMSTGHPDDPLNLAYPYPEYQGGNFTLSLLLGEFNDIHVTLQPRAGGTEFVFTSIQSAEAEAFFGAHGPYIKQ